MTLTISIWEKTQHVRDYIVCAVPRIGDTLVLDRKRTVRVVDVVWGLALSSRTPDDHDIDAVDVYVEDMP